MRDDLETEIQGLAQDIVRRNIGLGDEAKGLLPPDDLYSFLIINKNILQESILVLIYVLICILRSRDGMLDRL